VDSRSVTKPAAAAGPVTFTPGTEDTARRWDWRSFRALFLLGMLGILSLPLAMLLELKGREPC
jgi:hypothetical protein